MPATQVSFVGKLVGRTYVSFWHHGINVASMKVLLQELARESKALGKLIHCAYIPVDANNPLNPEAKTILGEFEPKILRYCDAIHVVFAGDGVVTQMLHVQLRAIKIGAPTRQHVSLHTSLESAAAAIEGASLESLSEAVRTLRQASLTVLA
jgi:hypothetical protein